MQIRLLHSTYLPRVGVLRALLLMVGLFAIALTVQSGTRSSRAQTSLNCSGDYYINEQLPNGAAWEFCWEHRYLEGIVVRDVHFTPQDGAPRKILHEAYVSQIHVPYDDNGTRYHDVTDYGIGGSNMHDLVAAECPSGTLLKHGSKAVVCKRVNANGHVYKAGTAGLRGHALSLFSVSQVGSYSYIPVWQFFDDGTIAPAMGATGKLQRRGPNNPYGWPIRSNFVTGISHIHNYYWKLDFELGADGSDDIVEEIDFVAANGSSERVVSVSQFTTEAARSVDPEKMRSWRIRDGATTNSGGSPISYELMPLRVGHRDVGPADEPWTHHDFYVSKYNACERYVSHNNVATGCGENVSEFVDGESLVGADPVLWYGLSFHHIPRDEDETFMHAHWDGFEIVPRDWTTQNPFVATATPTATDTPTPTGTPTPTTVPTATNTAINTPLATNTPASGSTATSTSTTAPTNVAPTNTATGSPTNVAPTNTATAAASPINASPTSTPVATNTPVPNGTPNATSTPVATNTPVPNGTPNATSTPAPTNTSVPNGTPNATNTAIPTATSGVQTTVTGTPQATATITPQPTATSVSPGATPDALQPLICTTYSNSDVPQELTFNVATAESELGVGPSTTIVDLNVKLNVTHDWIGDLTIEVEHVESGNSVKLLERPGLAATQWGCGGDDIVATFDDGAANDASAQCANSGPAISGTSRPADELSAFTDQDAGGTWRLTIHDAYPAAAHGALNSWSMEICGFARSNAGPVIRLPFMGR